MARPEQINGDIARELVNPDFFETKLVGVVVQYVVFLSGFSIAIGDRTVITSSFAKHSKPHDQHNCSTRRI